MEISGQLNKCMSKTRHALHAGHLLYSGLQAGRETFVLLFRNCSLSGLCNSCSMKVSLEDTKEKAGGSSRVLNYVLHIGLTVVAYMP